MLFCLTLIYVKMVIWDCSVWCEMLYTVNTVGRLHHVRSAFIDSFSFGQFEHTLAKRRLLLLWSISHQSVWLNWNGFISSLLMIRSSWLMWPLNSPGFEDFVRSDLGVHCFFSKWLMVKTFCFWLVFIFHIKNLQRIYLSLLFQWQKNNFISYMEWIFKVLSKIIWNIIPIYNDTQKNNLFKYVIYVCGV